MMEAVQYKAIKFVALQMLYLSSLLFEEMNGTLGPRPVFSPSVSKQVNYDALTTKTLSAFVPFDSRNKEPKVTVAVVRHRRDLSGVVSELADSVANAADSVKDVRGLRSISRYVGDKAGRLESATKPLTTSIGEMVLGTV